MEGNRKDKIRVLEKGQIKIPFEVRKKYEMKKGTFLHLKCEEDRIKMIPIT